MESLSISFSVRPPGLGLVTSSSSTSRSVRSLAKASSSVAIPFIGASALAIARMRPGTRGTVGGTKPSSTPSRITCIRAGSTPKSVEMSRLEVSDGVMMKRIERATRPCIRRKPYHRLRVNLRHGLRVWAMSMRRSKVIGWCRVVISGICCSMSSMP